MPYRVLVLFEYLECNPVEGDVAYLLMQGSEDFSVRVYDWSRVLSPEDGRYPRGSVSVILEGPFAPRMGDIHEGICPALGSPVGGEDSTRVKRWDSRGWAGLH